MVQLKGCIFIVSFTFHLVIDAWGGFKKTTMNNINLFIYLFLFGQKLSSSFFTLKMKNKIWLTTPLNSSGVLFGLNKFLFGFNLLVFSVVTFSDPLRLIKSGYREQNRDNRLS